jgi:hypothetical protein
VNSRQEKRRQKRRADHAARSGTADQPTVTMSRKSYPVVEDGHIVPKTYQQAWVVDGRVKVHEVGSDKRCRFRPVAKVAVREAPYRRVRPNGEEIDDVEASLNIIEGKATEPLRTLNEGGTLTNERKSILAQFLGIQIVRTSVFQTDRTAIVEFIRQIPADAMKPELLAEAGESVDRARDLLAEKYTSSTEAVMAMLQYGAKLGGILGLMRWQLIHFAQPRLVYSDHPIVLWPLGLPESQPFPRQKSGPLQTFEIRVPLGPSVGLLMNWIDHHDDARMEGTPTVAAEFNAFTVAQAETEWAHRPGRERLIPWRSFEPLSRLIEPNYRREAVVASLRFRHATKFVAEASGRKFVNRLPVL